MVSQPIPATLQERMAGLGCEQTIALTRNSVTLMRARRRDSTVTTNAQSIIG